VSAKQRIWGYLTLFTFNLFILNSLIFGYKKTSSGGQRFFVLFREAKIFMFIGLLIIMPEIENYFSSAIFSHQVKQPFERFLTPPFFG